MLEFQLGCGRHMGSSEFNEILNQIAGDIMRIGHGDARLGNTKRETSHQVNPIPSVNKKLS